MSEFSQGDAPLPPDGTAHGTAAPRPAAPRFPHPALTRRHTLAALAAVTAATAVAGCGSDGRPSARPTAPVRAVDPLAAEPFTPVTGKDGAGVLLQVMAHPDDDLYFMNPDAEDLLRAGASVVCVYVTAGEARGINRAPGAPLPEPDKAAYSASRHQGLRQAYAQMLGVHRFTRWRRSVIDLPGGVRAESNELTAGHRRVQLVFLNVAMLSGNGVRLPHLWDVPDVVANTLVAKGSPLKEVFGYRHETLVDVLAGIMDRVRPTMIHTLDPDPDFQVHDAAHPQDNDQPGCSDHRDHTPVALFTWKAMSQWVADASRRDGRAPRFVTTAFRGYYNQRWPHNLPPQMLARKAGPLVAYGGAPDWHCGDAAGCGDYSQGGDRPLLNRKGWIRSTHYRYPGTVPVSGTDRSGRVEAYGVLGTQAVRWRETRAGSGRWGEPENLGGGPLVPALATVVDHAGRRLLFGLRISALEGQGRANTREIVVLEERAPDSSRRSGRGAFRPWQSLGNPEALPDHGRRVGVPVAIATGDGRVHLFVRTADKALATRVRDARGVWGPWQRLGGGEIQDGLTCVLDAQGRVHVFAAGRATVQHWAQDQVGGPVACRPLPGLPLPGERPAAALDEDGRLALVYRTPAAAQPEVHRIDTAPAGPADPANGAAGRVAGSSALRHFGGYAPLTAHAQQARGGRDRIVLLGRSDTGSAQLQTGVSADAVPERAPGRPVLVGTASLLVDAGHRLCVVGMAPDAQPWLWRPDGPIRA